VKAVPEAVENARGNRARKGRGETAKDQGETNLIKQSRMPVFLDFVESA
jgi:hypothetical protein